MAFTVNLYYTGTGGNARKFAEEMKASGLVERIRAEKGNLRNSDSSTRATREQNDPDARPQINGGVMNMQGYDILFLGRTARHIKEFVIEKNSGEQFLAVLFSERI